MNTTTPSRFLPAAAPTRWPVALVLALLLGACAGNTSADGSDTGNDTLNDTAADGADAAETTTDDAATDVGSTCTDGATCEDGDPCTSGETCKDGACTGGGPKDCDDGSPCTTDTCNKTKGGCTHTADSSNDGKPGGCEDGDACTAGDSCKAGACLPGSVTDCDDGNVCTDDSCDKAKGCAHTATTEKDKSCDDGKNCTLGDHCIGALCIPDTVASCADDNPCTEDGCDDNGCTHTASAEGKACSDGDACTKDDACKAGTCVGSGKTCDDDNACTEDACDPKTSACSYTTATPPKDSKLACDDGDPCTAPDHCAGALCLAGPVTACDDNNVCTTDSCSKDKGCTHTANTLPCDDGSFCTFLETCKDGACSPGKAKVCVDGVACTTDGCDDKTGNCTFTKLTGTTEKPAPCDDGDVCTKDEACKDGVCQGGQPGGCDDGNACTFDICDAAKGCLNVKTAAACDDGDGCTTGDQCQDGACKSFGVVGCDDGKSCTDDSCDKKNGTCSNVAKADGSACDDGDPCTTGEGCAAGTCTAPTAKAEAVIRTTPASFSDLPEVALGDLDGDAKPDLVAAYVDGTRRNLPHLGAMTGKGKGNFDPLKSLGAWQNPARCVGAVPNPVLLLADVDGDKDLDLLVGGVTHSSCQAGDDIRAEAAWFIENKAGVMQTPSVLHDFGLLGSSTKFTQTLGLAWGRFKGGTSYQLAVHYATQSTTPGAEIVHAIKVLTPASDGGKTLWTSWTISPTTPLTDLSGFSAMRSQLRVADLDGDGRDDLVPQLQMGELWGGGLILRASSSAPGTFEPSKVSTMNGKIAESVWLPGDFDGDGDVDLVGQPLLDDSGASSFKNPALLYTNDGSASWWKAPGLTGATHIDKPPGGTYDVQVIQGAFDLEGDGRDDVVGMISDNDGNKTAPAFWVTDPGKAAAYLGSPVITQEIAIAGMAQLDGVGGEEVVVTGEKVVLAVTVAHDGCQDGNSCTLDSCDKSKGCTATPLAAACNDGDACTANDVCNAGTCQAGPAQQCDDGNPCTDDSCDKAAGCTYANNTVTCTNGGCSGTCKDGNCSVNPKSEVCNGIDDDCDGTVDNGITCDDGNPCTADTCNAQSGNCAHTAITGDCDDGDDCTVNDACDNGTCKGGSNVCPACGNGAQESDEGCDDGNSTNGDGCSSSCEVESGYTCSGTPSKCAASA